MRGVAMETLYEKIGGDETIRQLVATFYRNVLADPVLQPFFKDVSIEKLKRMQRAFFSVALGGPEPESKVSLYEAHRDHGIERKHLTRFTDHLIETLAEIGVPEESAKRVYQRIATYSDEILGDTSVDG